MYSSHCCQYVVETLDYVVFLWRVLSLVLAGCLSGWTQAHTLLFCSGQELPPLLSSSCLELLLFFPGILGTFPHACSQESAKTLEGIATQMDGFVVCGFPLLGFYPLFSASDFQGRAAASCLGYSSPRPSWPGVPSGKKLYTCIFSVAILFFQGLPVFMFLLFSCSLISSTSVLYFFPKCILIIYGRITLI